MKSFAILFCLHVWVLAAGCGSSERNPAAEAPPPVQVEHEQDAGIFKVDHPERFPLVAAVKHDAAPELAVTGTVNPDIAKTVPVITLASGRVVGIYARLGDTVKKGQRLLTVRSDDVAVGYSDYRKAVSDEFLARTQLDRAKDLYAHGANSLNDLQVAQDNEDKAKVDLETTAEHLRLLGNDPDHVKMVVDIFAPVAGVITDQQVTNAAGVQAFSSTNPFTISDLSTVWVLCDVYEIDLPQVHIGDTADLHLNAYPNLTLNGKVSNIGPILDPVIRTAKVRIEVQNPGMLRVGMFVTAKFRGLKKDTHAAVPATAVLHLHDRNWVYVPANDKSFQRVEVRTGVMLPENLQEIISGIKPDDQVIQNALVFQNTVEQ
jgi:cobalt-zinc-cadmium efflux system membrane fusion protein